MFEKKSRQMQQNLRYLMDLVWQRKIPIRKAVRKYELGEMFWIYKHPRLLPLSSDPVRQMSCSVCLQKNLSLPRNTSPISCSLYKAKYWTEPDEHKVLINQANELPNLYLVKERETKKEPEPPSWKSFHRDFCGALFKFCHQPNWNFSCRKWVWPAVLA